MRDMLARDHALTSVIQSRECVKSFGTYDMVDAKCHLRAWYEMSDKPISPSVIPSRME